MASEKVLSHFTHLYGLIGYPLSHSFSKRYFTEKFQKEQRTDAFYELFSLANIEELPVLLGKYPNLKGLNVTIPYKVAVLPFLTKIDPAAAAVGAVNTIKISNGVLEGYNTDVLGFGQSLQKWLKLHNREIPGALVLGTGGAAKGVTYVLRQMNIPYLMVSREQKKGDLTYDEVDKFILKNHPLIINTTPLGMSPNIDTFPEIPYEQLSPENTLYDLVYNPEKTVFLRKGEKQQCLIHNGLEMLQLQAEGAWDIWNP